MDGGCESNRGREIVCGRRRNTLTQKSATLRLRLSCFRRNEKFGPHRKEDDRQDQNWTASQKNYEIMGFGSTLRTNIALGWRGALFVLSTYRNEGDVRISMLTVEVLCSSLERTVGVSELVEKSPKNTTR